MYEFLQTFEKKRAFKKALKEVIIEKPEPIISSEPKENVSPVAAVQTVRPYSHAIKNPLRKPETTAIDLKNFKDWRQTDTVKSDAPRVKPRTPFFDDEDEPIVKKPIENEEHKEETKTQLNTVDMMDKLAAIPKEETKDTSIETYIAEKTEDKVEPVRKKVTLQQLVDRFNSTSQVAPEPVENKIKVEVVDFSDHKPAIKNKAPAKRKPRGKSKRKFDADVISSVDWK